MLYILSTSFVLTPLFFGGCVSCPQVQTHILVTHRRRISILQFEELPCSGADFWVYTPPMYMFMFIQGTAGPCPVIWFAILCRGL